jgi:hypothetical protein
VDSQLPSLHLHLALAKPIYPRAEYRFTYSRYTT